MVAVAYSYILDFQTGLGINNSYRLFKISEIERAFRLLQRSARNAMRIDHRGPYIAVPEKRLDSTDIVISLKKVRGEGMAEGVGRDALCESGPPYSLIERQLNVCFMKMKPPQLPCFLYERIRRLREEPLPDEILGG